MTLMRAARLGLAIATAVLIPGSVRVAIGTTRLIWRTTKATLAIVGALTIVAALALAAIAAWRAHKRKTAPHPTRALRIVAPTRDHAECIAEWNASAQPYNAICQHGLLLNRRDDDAWERATGHYGTRARYPQGRPFGDEPDRWRDLYEQRPTPPDRCRAELLTPSRGRCELPAGHTGEHRVAGYTWEEIAR